MKIACVAETPFQLINAINLFRNDPEFQEAEVDLFIPADHFHHEDRILNNLTTFHVFHEVHTYKQENRSIADESFRKGLLDHPEKMISRKVGNNYIFPYMEYDIIFTAAIYGIFIAMLFCCRKASVYCYEDGTISYCAADWMHGLTPPSVQELIKEELGCDPLSAERIYLNNPDLFRYPWKTRAFSLPPIEEAIHKEPDLYYGIFGKPETDYAANRIIFLAQSSEIPEDITSEITGSITAPFICRYHPRIGKDVDYGGIPDHSESQWELICADQITEDHILISACSSAMTSPKWLFNKEPYLIFLIPIYSKRLDHHHVHTTELIIAETRLLYDDPGKIFIAYSIEELNEIISRILSKHTDLQ